MVDNILLSMTLHLAMPTSLRCAAAAVALAIILPMQPAFARAPVPPSPQQATQPIHKASAKPDVDLAPSNAELDRFAHAVVDVGNIKRSAQPGIEGAPSQADRKRLEQATVQQIKAAIRGNHLSVHRYMQIVAYVQAHPMAQRNVVAMMKQLMPPLPPQQLN